MSRPLVKEFEYKVSVKSLWQALTDAASMKQWYFPQLQSMEPTVGSVFQFHDGNADYQKVWIVTKVETERVFAHSWSYKGFPGTSEILFELAPAGSGTRLTLTQTGLETFPDHPHFGRERFEWGWDNLLGQNLRNLLNQSVQS